jgi:hypothetical protein
MLNTKVDLTIQVKKFGGRHHMQHGGQSHVNIHGDMFYWHMDGVN